MRVLVIAAHPDDEVIGAGGTIAKHAERGDEVHVCILTDGVGARQGDAEKQKECARSAAKALGVSNVHFLDFADQKLDTYPILEVTQAIEGAMGDVNPDIVYTHTATDPNKDHQVAFEATLVATRPAASKIRQVLCYEVNPYSWADATKHNMTTAPNVYVDIKDTFSLKIRALMEYKNEIKEYPHPRSEEALRAMGMRRGVEAGLEMAEGFFLLREVKK